MVGYKKTPHGLNTLKQQLSQRLTKQLWEHVQLNHKHICSLSLPPSPSSSKIRAKPGLLRWRRLLVWHMRPMWPITGTVFFFLALFFFFFSRTPSVTQRIEDKNKWCIVSVNDSLQVALGEIIWTWQEFDFFEESSWYKRHVFSYFHFTIIPHAASHTLLASKPKHLNSPGSLVYKPLDAVWWSISQRWQQREGIWVPIIYKLIFQKPWINSMSVGDYITGISMALGSSFQCTIMYQPYN